MTAVPRPCGHAELRDDCGQCRLWENPKIRALWEAHAAAGHPLTVRAADVPAGKPAAPLKAGVVECPLRSAGPVAVESCKSCRGRVELKVFGCSVHGTCVPVKAGAGHHVCKGCKDNPLVHGEFIPLPPAPPLALSPASDRAVVVCAHGEAGRRLLAASGPSLRRYAARLGADFVVLDTDPPVPGVGPTAKLHAGRVLDHYERIVLTDADVWVPDGAGDVFAACRPDEAGFCDDLPFHRGGEDSPAARAYHQFRDAHGLPDLRGRLPGLPNTGVLVVPRSGRAVLDPPARLYVPHAHPGRHLCEQFWTGSRVHAGGFLVRVLPREFNWQNWTDPGFRDAPPDAIRHWSGAASATTDRAGRAGEIAAAEATRQVPPATR